MKKTSSLILLTALAGSVSAPAAVLLAGWETWGPAPLPGQARMVDASQIATGITASVSIPGQSGAENTWQPSTVPANATGDFGSAVGGYAGASTDVSSFNSGTYANPTSATGNTYLDFTITAASGPVTLDSFHFDGSMGGNQSTRTWTLTIQDGSAISTGVVAGPTGFGNFNALSQEDIDLTGLVDRTLEAGESATFRLNFVGNGNGGNGIRLDNVGIAGVPEPSSVMLFGGIGLLLIRRRRN